MPGMTCKTPPKKSKPPPGKPKANCKLKNTSTFAMTLKTANQKSLKPKLSKETACLQTVRAQHN